MNSSARHISVAVVCALALAGCSSAGSTETDGAATTAPSVSPSTSASASPGTPAEPTDPAGPAKSRSAGTTPDSGSGSTEAPASQGPTTSPESPLEVLSPSPSPSGLPGLSPAPKPDKPLISQPLPTQGSADGTLVDGYPASVLPPARGSTIETSSVSPTGRRLQVALNARTGQGAGGVLLFYRQTLTALGFTEDNVSATAGNQAAGFRRGQSSVTVTVTRKGDVSSYTLFSTLYAG